jgi:hypothetical protein
MADDAQEPEGIQLTDEQMRDLVQIAHPQTAAEAAFLVSILEENDIPAVTHGQNSAMTGLFGCSPVCVPRILAAQADKVLEEAKRQANGIGVSDAFEEDAIEESVAETPNDPILAEMFQISDNTLEDRRELVVPHLINWATIQVSEVQVARYLAAAGIPREEAADFVRKTLSTHHELLEKSKEDRRMAGYLMLGATPLALIAGIFFLPQILGLFIWAAIALLTVGSAFVYSASKSTAVLSLTLPPDSSSQPATVIHSPRN